MKLTGLKIDNYKSIDSSKADIEDMNILIGKNNAGKSSVVDSLIDVFSMIGNMGDRPDWDKRLIRRDDSGKLKVETVFELESEDKEWLFQRLLGEDCVDSEYRDYYDENDLFRKINVKYIYSRHSGTSTKILGTINGEFNIDIRTASSRLEAGNLPGIESSDNPSHRIEPKIRSLLEDFVEGSTLLGTFRKPEESMLAQKQDMLLENSGQDLVGVLDTMKSDKPNDFSTVEETYADIVEGVDWLGLSYVGEAGSKERTIKVYERGFSDGFTLDEISAGSKEILMMITKLVIAGQSKGLLIIEEPELHLHPSAQTTLYHLLKDITEDGPQVLLTTHSETFVNRADSSNIVSVKREVETKLNNVGEEGIDRLLTSLGYEKSELYQADAVVFVEGRSDRVILKEMARTIDRPFENIGITVHPLGGDRLRRHGEEISSLLDHIDTPYQFIVDSDDMSPSDKKEELTNLLGTQSVTVLSKYCIESYLTESPGSIASAFDFDIDDVRDFLSENSNKSNKSEVMKRLFENMTDGEITYDKEEHGWTITKHMDADDIDLEIQELIDMICELPAQGRHGS